MHVQSSRYQSLERPRLQLQLTVSVQKQMVESQAPERVIFYQLYTCITCNNFHICLALILRSKIGMPLRGAQGMVLSAKNFGGEAKNC